MHFGVQAHGKAPVQQALVDCVPIKHEPCLLPTSAFRSEFLRLKAEAEAAGHPSGPTWVDRKCREFIRFHYGQRCYYCDQTIDLHLDVEPISRKLDEDDKTPANHGSEVFHKFCWGTYQREKTKKRRRTKYEEKHGEGQPANQNAHLAPEVNGGEPAIDIQEVAIEAGQPAVEVNPFAPPAVIGEVM